jgi:hypothetical protein
LRSVRTITFRRTRLNVSDFVGNGTLLYRTWRT